MGHYQKMEVFQITNIWSFRFFIKWI